MLRIFEALYICVSLCHVFCATGNMFPHYKMGQLFGSLGVAAVITVTDVSVVHIFSGKKQLDSAL